MPTREPPYQTGVGGIDVGRSIAGGIGAFQVRKSDQIYLPSLERVRQFHLDIDMMWRKRWRKEAIYSIMFGTIWLAWLIFLIYVVISQPSAGQAWRF